MCTPDTKYDSAKNLAHDSSRTSINVKKILIYCISRFQCQGCGSSSTQTRSMAVRTVIIKVDSWRCKFLKWGDTNTHIPKLITKIFSGAAQVENTSLQKKALFYESIYIELCTFLILFFPYQYFRKSFKFVYCCQFLTVGLLSIMKNVTFIKRTNSVISSEVVSLAFSLFLYNI